jgi:hydrogen cyanide synthase HcnB
VPGWTLPGVYTLGGAQVALKFQGCAIGQRVVFMGTGPLLYLVAYQYTKAGAKVAAVLDTARLSDQIAATPAMLRRPAVFAKGVYFVAWLRAHGVPLHSGVRPLRVIGDDEAHARHRRRLERRPRRAHARLRRRRLRLCAALRDAIGRPARLPLRLRAACTAPTCRCAMRRAAPASKACTSRAMAPASWAPTRPSGPASAPRSRCSRTAAWPSMPRAPQHSNASSKRFAGFRRGLERAFPLPQDWAANAPDDLVVCRCENVTAGTLRQTVSLNGADEMNRLKALSRVGMGRCQGRMCGVAAAEILAHATGQPLQQVGRLRGQAPIKPIPIQLAVHAANEGAGA